jgi:hypothetical protein
VFFRVFGTLDTEPALEAFSLQSDHRGWYRARRSTDTGTVAIERYLADEDGIRDELNTWAAWVEVASSGTVQERLMRHLIATKQVFVLRDPPAEYAEELCRFLARATDGVYQIDGRGFFDADGSLLVAED